MPVAQVELTKEKIREIIAKRAAQEFKRGDVVTLVGTRDEHEGDPQVGGPSYAVRAKAE